MISHADVTKLSTVRAREPVVLSLYLPVPLDPAELRGLPAHAANLMASAGVTGEDRDRVLAKVAALGRDWLGHGVAIFACAGLRMLEVHRLPDSPPERALLGSRPWIRPLLAMLQRHPGYRVAVVDRKHAWVLAIAGEEIATVADSIAASMPSDSFGGWYGLEAYRVHERVIQLARRHYRDTAAILAAVIRQAEPAPLVIGGHRDGIGQLLSWLPPAARDMYIGSFAADTHALTPARVRELADPIVSKWAEQRARLTAAEISQLPPGQAAVGLEPCLAAVNAGAAEVLVVPAERQVPGYVCGRCEALCVESCDCPDWGTAAEPVPDLMEELVIHATAQDGKILVVPDVPGGLLAKLRFPVSSAEDSALCTRCRSGSRSMARCPTTCPSWRWPRSGRCCGSRKAVCGRQGCCWRSLRARPGPPRRACSLSSTAARC